MSNNDKEKQPLLSSINSDENNGANIKIVEPVPWYSKIKNSMSKETITILIYVVLYVCSGVINSVLLKKVMNKFTNYAFFLSQLTNFGYVPIFGAVTAYKIFFTNDIPKETRDFPTRKFAIMGALDAITGFFVVIGGVSTSGPLQQLLNQAIIPVTMITSFFFLKERYSFIQLGGALVIIGGVITSLIPSLVGGSGGNKPFWNFFYLLSVIPGSFSNVYKVVGFQAVDDMDVWYLQYWDSLYQSIFGIFLFPINNWLPPPATIKFNQILPFMKEGAECLAGINTILPSYYTYPNGTESFTVNSCTYDPKAALICDDCHNAWIAIILYMSINIVYNIFILLVLKHAGATVYSIANTLRLPLTNIAFSIPFIMGAAVSPFSPLSVAGLVIILVGLGGYRVGSMVKQKKDAAAASGQVKVIPSYGPAGMDNVMPVQKQFIEPKSQAHLRNSFFGKLGIAVPEAKYRAANNNNYGDV
ncbi:hypothetical protein RB653_003125 [Dictyostelium firmibasis]|uniref:Uncharacterized protein n=1 Tax=Dictyostelium firmibasis TaxID=79012 RepID=A0AAN7TXT0_9MYCE